MKIRTLLMSLNEAVDKFERVENKFFEDRGDHIVIEVPRNGETWRVEIPIEPDTVEVLENNDFIKQLVTWEY